MKTIHKYDIAVQDEISEILMPWGAEIVHVGVQKPEVITIWAFVNTEAAPEARKFLTTGTGHPITEDVKHVGSVFDGPFVWHLLEVAP